MFDRCTDPAPADTNEVGEPLEGVLLRVVGAVAVGALRLEDGGDDGGTGLGLSICRTIVESHGGHLWAHNEPDGGLSMCFALPILTEDSPS